MLAKSKTAQKTTQTTHSSYLNASRGRFFLFAAPHLVVSTLPAFGLHLGSIEEVSRAQAILSPSHRPPPNRKTRTPISAGSVGHLVVSWVPAAGGKTAGPGIYQFQVFLAVGEGAA